MLCIAYVILIGACLGIAGLSLERVLPPRIPRRWLWCAVIAVTMTVPPIYQAYHTAPIHRLPLRLDGASLAQTTSSSAGSSSEPYAGPWAEYALLNRLWLAASAAVVIWGLAGAARTFVLLRRSRRRVRRISVDGVPVIVTDRLGPATVGLLRSQIVVPRWVLAMPGMERRYVLRHEEEHRKSYDALLLLIASLGLVLTPWNVSLWWQLRRLRLAVEMDCDNRVVAALGEPLRYGSVLFRIAEAASRGPGLQPAFLGAGMVERRLRSLLAPAPLRQAYRIVLPIAAALLLILVFVLPHPVPALSAAHAGPSEGTSTLMGPVPAGEEHHSR